MQLLKGQVERSGRHDLTTIKFERLVLHSIQSPIDTKQFRFWICLLELRQIEVMDNICLVSLEKTTGSKEVLNRTYPGSQCICHNFIRPVSSHSTKYVAHLTCPSSSNLAFVSVSKGVDANTHTPPLLSRIAVDRPPTASKPSRANGLK